MTINIKNNGNIKHQSHQPNGLNHAAKLREKGKTV